MTTLLILGSPRSGTTLLSAMLGRHSEAAVLNENFAYGVHDIVGKQVAGNKLCMPNQIEMEETRPAWTRLFGPRFYHWLFRRGYFERRPQSLRSISDYLSFGSKVIATVRDGNSVVSSIMKRGEQEKELAAYRWCRTIDILSEIKHRSDVLIIPFSRLVSEPEEAMRSASSHLGLSYEPRMLEGHSHTPQYSNEKIDPGKAQSKPDLGIEKEYPESHRKYLRLTNRS